MCYGSNSVRTFWMILMVLCAAAGTDAGIARGQAASEALLSPPDWIQGEWHNSAESNTRNWEQIAFTPHGVTLTKGLPVNRVVDSSRSYKDYGVKETVGAKTYQVEFTRAGKASCMSSSCARWTLARTG